MATCRFYKCGKYLRKAINIDASHTVIVKCARQCALSSVRTRHWMVFNVLRKYLQHHHQQLNTMMNQIYSVCINVCLCCSHLIFIFQYNQIDERARYFFIPPALNLIQYLKSIFVIIVHLAICLWCREIKPYSRFFPLSLSLYLHYWKLSLYRLQFCIGMHHGVQSFLWSVFVSIEKNFSGKIERKSETSRENKTLDNIINCIWTLSIIIKVPNN